MKTNSDIRTFLTSGRKEKPFRLKRSSTMIDT